MYPPYGSTFLHMIYFELHCMSSGKTGQHSGSCGNVISLKVAWQLSLCVCVYHCIGGLTSMGGWRCGQWELSSCQVRMCPGRGGQFSFFLCVCVCVCLSMWLHKQMGADILISTGNTLGLFSAGIWHQQATGKILFHLCRDAHSRCTAGHRNVNEACRLPAQIWKYNRHNPQIIPVHSWT